MTNLYTKVFLIPDVRAGVKAKQLRDDFPFSVAHLPGKVVYSKKSDPYETGSRGNYAWLYVDLIFIG